MPPGAYKVKVWYQDDWVALGDGVAVDVAAKGKTELNPKIPAAALTPGAKK